MKKFTWLILSLSITLAACSPSDKQANTQQSPVAASSIDMNQKAKSDVAKIYAAWEQADLQNLENRKTQWHKQLDNAKTNADIKAVFTEQVNFYRNAERILQSLKMESEQGKKVHQQILHGFSGVRGVLEEVEKVNFEQSAGVNKMKALTPKLEQSSLEVMQGMLALIEMMKANGIKPNRDDEALFRQQLNDFKKDMKSNQ